MKKTNLSLVLALGTACLVSSAFAQNVVSAAPSVAAPATSPVPAASQIIFTPRLPTPQELTNAASAQGMTIERIEQTSAQVTVVYKYSDGQTKAVAYQILPVAGATTAPTVTVVGTAPAATTVYYEASPRVVYYEPGYYPYAYGWYPPVSLRLGVGFGFHGGGGFRRGRW